MGLFDDMKKASEMSADQPVVVPAGRIDLMAADPVSGEQRRRTDYAGTVWYGGLPQMLGKHPLPGDTAAQIKAPFWLPDSLIYESAAAGDARIQATAAVQGGLATTSGGNFQILEVAAALGEGPGDAGGLRLYVAVTAVASLPFGVAYRVSVSCAPGALRPDSV